MCPICETTTDLNFHKSYLYKELGRLHEVGEIFDMDSGIFRDTGDINIDAILRLVETIQQVKESIRNINGLD